MRWLGCCFAIVSLASAAVLGFCVALGGAGGKCFVRTFSSSPAGRFFFCLSNARRRLLCAAAAALGFYRKSMRLPRRAKIFWYVECALAVALCGGCGAGIL